MSSKNILIAPLDWGLGHTTRCIPIIELLISRGHNVFTCGDKNSEILFKEHFPKIEHFIIDGYRVKYSHRHSQAISMIIQTPKFLRIIKSETKIANKLSAELNLDYIFSDNRFGFRSKNTVNVFISHQIHIQGPLILKSIMYKINSSYINKFNHCFIPDILNKNNLSGNLSKNPLPNNCNFIGALSRFKQAIKTEKTKYKYLAILSGPEPQRSIFEKIIFNEFSKLNCRSAIIGGNPLGNSYTTNNISYINHASTEDFKEILASSKFIICRAGYSSIMDLAIIQKRALLIPTPGQTEQEYLAKYHNKLSGMPWLEQSDFKLNELTLFGEIINYKPNNNLENKLIEIGL